MNQVLFDKQANQACRDNNKSKKENPEAELTGGNVDEFLKENPDETAAFEYTYVDWKEQAQYVVADMVMEYYKKQQEEINEKGGELDFSKVPPVLSETLTKLGISMIGTHPKHTNVIQLLFVLQGTNKME